MPTLQKKEEDSTLPVEINEEILVEEAETEGSGKNENFSLTDDPDIICIQVINNNNTF